MVKILFLPKYPRLGASSRLRTYQFLPFWERKGFETTTSSFFNETYLKQVYSGRTPGVLNVLACYFRRLGILTTVWKYDVIWIEKEAFPFLPSYAEWILEKIGKGYIVDYDDAVFHNYDQHAKWLVRFWMGNKIDWVMRHSKLVIAGNNYLGNRAKEAGTKSIKILPTVIDPLRYPTKSHKSSNSPLRIGWIGSPTTLKYLSGLSSVFEDLSRTSPFELLIINAESSEQVFMGCPTRYIPWTEQTEVSSILEMDIGLMPLPENKWEKGKCAYKLIQYMACGIPVVASPVGMNTEVVKHGENGFLAQSMADWSTYLSLLLQDVSLRTSMGKKGRAMVMEKFTIEKNFVKMEEIIKNGS